MKLKQILIILLVISILLNACDKNERKDDSSEITKPAATSITPSVTLKPTVTQVPQSLPTAAATTKPTAAPSLFPEPINLANSMKKEEYPVVDGSTATIPLSEAVYQLATGASPEEAAADIVHTKTTQSYYRLMNGEADILIVYEPSEEVKEYMKSNKINLQIKPIGKDALVFMANASNPVESLTNEELVKIYSGQITNWSEVGGEDKELLAFQRPVNSGSQTLMQKLVMGEVPMVEGPQVVYYTEMEGILKAMVEYNNEGNTLGYSVFYYAKNMYNLPELKFMKVNGVEPSLESIYDNSYPFVNEFYAVIREDEPKDSNAHKIFDWLTQEEGQSLVRNLGYVPVSLALTQGENEEKLITDQLPEGYKYILQSDYTTDSEISVCSITIYEKNWKVRKVINNVSYINETGLVSNDTPVKINMAVYNSDGSYSFREGLYSLVQEEYVLPAIYDYLYPLDEKHDYYHAYKEEMSYIFDKEGKVLISDSGKGYIERKGEYYWNIEYSELSNTKARIYDHDFKLIREITMDVTGNTIYSDDGEVIFSKEMFLKHFNYKDNGEFNLNNYNDSMMVIYYDDHYWVLDRKLNVINKYKGEISGSLHGFLLFNDIYCEMITDPDTYDQECTFYDKDGKILLDDEGNPYTAYVNDFSSSGDIILYRYGTDIIELYRSSTGQRLKLELEDVEEYRFDSAIGDMLILRSDYGKIERMKIYLQDKLIFNHEGYYYIDRISDNKDILIFTCSYENSYLNYYYLLDSEGNIRYQSVYPERITGFDDKYIQLTRGNYTAVINYDGQYIIKNIKEGLSDD